MKISIFCTPLNCPFLIVRSACWADRDQQTRRDLPPAAHHLSIQIKSRLWLTFTNTPIFRIVLCFLLKNKRNLNELHSNIVINITINKTGTEWIISFKIGSFVQTVYSCSCLFLTANCLSGIGQQLMVWNRRNVRGSHLARAAWLMHINNHPYHGLFRTTS